MGNSKILFVCFAIWLMFPNSVSFFWSNVHYKKIYLKRLEFYVELKNVKMYRVLHLK